MNEVPGCAIASDQDYREADLAIDFREDVPPLAEFLPPYDASTWLGVGAPKNTPREIVEKLNAEINTALADPNMQERIANFGYAVLPGSPAEFGKFIVEETEKWGEVVRAANMKPD